jgi:ribulose-phosphate 3-epimerase
MKLAPSLLSADFSRLYDEACAVEPLADRFHWDVMDGHFVSNLTFGPPVVNALRKRLSLPFDVHLMIEHPLDLAPHFDVGPDDSIIFHAETGGDPAAVIAAIARTSARIGITLRPATSLKQLSPFLDDVSLVLVMSVEPGFGGQAFLPEALDRIRALREMLGERAVEIAVDGGIHAGNVRSVVQAGADIIVAGSAIFGQPDPAAAAAALRQAAA